MIAKYLAMSLAIEKVVSAPRVMSSCLPISTISMSLVGSESRSTMFPASLAAALLLLLDQRQLVLGLGLGQEVVHPGLVRDRLGGQRVVTRDHHGADAH